MVSRVVEIRVGVVQFEPLCRGISYRHATAREIIAYWRKTGRRGPGPADEADIPERPIVPRSQLSCASRHEQFGRAHAGTQDHPFHSRQVRVPAPPQRPGG
jgi:hypothetical protein